MWNLDKIHKVGELTAAIAVVVSLLFVGYEIQENNQTQKRLTTRSLARDWSYAVSSLQESELACLWLRMWNGSADLSAREKIQIEMLNLGLPDRFVEHGDPKDLITRCGLDKEGILKSLS